ncbi:polysaccharide deacetylase family protein [Halorhabdus amylolytica]|uniref:hypothetical protein n=1 Tax=Halorhabdus amylolytica TaxID=2559573 RepID=UPI0010AB4902|nr:hypothetical protein [Halorhabdus amylolytica]
MDRERPTLRVRFRRRVRERLRGSPTGVPGDGRVGEFAIVPDWLGDANRLTVDQIRTLDIEGHEVLGHGRRHRYLGTHRVTADAAAGDRAVTSTITSFRRGITASTSATPTR